MDESDSCKVLKQALRIAIIGNAGLGKSTVGPKIYAFGGLHHLDKYFGNQIGLILIEMNIN